MKNKNNLSNLYLIINMVLGDPDETIVMSIHENNIRITSNDNPQRIVDIPVGNFLKNDGNACDNWDDFLRSNETRFRLDAIKDGTNTAVLNHLQLFPNADPAVTYPKSLKAIERTVQTNNRVKIEKKTILRTFSGVKKLDEVNVVRVLRDSGVNPDHLFDISRYLSTFSAYMDPATRSFTETYKSKFVIDENAASEDEVKRVVGLCPSGALKAED